MHKWMAIFRYKRNQKNESDVGKKKKKKKKEQGKEEAWARGKWMRQEETREGEEVGGWKRRSRMEGEGKRNSDSRGEKANPLCE